MPQTLDLKGLKCPLPVLRARKALNGMAPDEELVILVTDPAAPDDFRAFCDQTGHGLVGIEAEGDAHRVTVRRKSQ